MRLAPKTCILYKGKWRSRTASGQRVTRLKDGYPEECRFGTSILELVYRKSCCCTQLRRERCYPVRHCRVGDTTVITTKSFRERTGRAIVKTSVVVPTNRPQL